MLILFIYPNFKKEFINQKLKSLNRTKKYKIKISEKITRYKRLLSSGKYKPGQSSISALLEALADRTTNATRSFMQKIKTMEDCRFMISLFL